MITFTITWHFAIMILLQIIIILRVLYIAATERGGGYLGKGFGIAIDTIFYIFISLIIWLIYGGIVWW